MSDYDKLKAFLLSCFILLRNIYISMLNDYKSLPFSHTILMKKKKKQQKKHFYLKFVNYATSTLHQDNYPIFLLFFIINLQTSMPKGNKYIYSS